MRGDRRCSSFRKEKPAGLSRALSWFNVSNLGRQSRRIFRSQSELHRIHGHPVQAQQPHSAHRRRNKHADSDEIDDDDDDDWVYHPQHRRGEGLGDRLNGPCVPARRSRKWRRAESILLSALLAAGSAHWGTIRVGAQVAWHVNYCWCFFRVRKPSLSQRFAMMS